ncbi:MAG: YcaO-like family protein [Parabacteroides sp.]|nr:YcaO-like family protein [Parabacteroides sp.]
MEKISRRKKYKAVDAATTINTIRNILYRNGIVVREIHYDNKGIGTYSCSVHIAQEELNFLELGTNGKGMTFEYSLASAYAEFMERLENDLIFKNLFIFYPKKGDTFFLANREIKDFVEKEHVVKDFLMHPDEIKLTQDELVNRCFPVLSKLFDKQDTDALAKTVNEMEIFSGPLKSITALPYLNRMTEKIEYLPVGIIRSICGSNGMCAGNTKKEALIQGICEIFERYATRKIFYENIALPTIPKTYFEGERVYDLLTDIEKNKNYSVVIKDASCGIGLPVVGLLIIDRTSRKYHFHLGSDPSIITALERCLTEIYQGASHAIRLKFADIPEKDYFIDPSTGSLDMRLLKEEFLLSMKNGTGKWPMYILDDNPDFGGIYKNQSDSDEEDLNYLLKIIRESGFNLYVRDVSTYGFPALHAIIPGMSQIQMPDGETNIKLFGHFTTYHLKTLFRLKKSSVTEIKELAFALHRLCRLEGKSRAEISSYFAYLNNESLKTLSTELLLSMLFYRVGEPGLAEEYIGAHIERNKQKGKDLYLYCAKDYMKYKKQRLSNEEIKTKLALYYDINLVNVLMDDFHNPERVFDHHDFPTCFECDQCQLKKACVYIPYVRFLSRMKDRKIENPISQNDLLKELI